MSEKNQCDGCQAGKPLRGTLHIDDAGHAVMSCQMDRYAAPPAAHGCEFELWQDGAPVVTASSKERREALEELLLYALAYGSSSPVSIYCVRRELVTGEEQR